MQKNIILEKDEAINSNIKKNMTGYFVDTKNRAIAILLAVFIGALFAIVILDHRVGINYFALSAAMIASVGYVMYKDDNLNIGKFTFWALVFLMYTSVFFRLNNIMYTAFTFLLFPALFILATIFSGKKLPANIVVNGLFRFFSSIAFVDKIFIAIRSLVYKEGEKNKALPIKIIIGVVISLVLLLMIIPLMFSADSIFEKIIVELIDLQSVFEFLWKTVLAIVIAILFFSFLYIITVKKDTIEKSQSIEDKVFNVESTLLVILTIVAIVYTAFSIIQFTHLFGGLDRALPESFSLTEYARSGYFEQVTLTIINLAIIGVTIFFTNRSNGIQKIAINIMLLYFIAINFYLMISSAYKMGLYQIGYGFTVLRIMVDILLVFEAVIFIFLAIKVINRKLLYLTYMLYFSVAFWAIVSFINIQGASAELNIKRYEEGEDIDIHYIANLDDTSKQLKYIYIEYFDDLTEEEILDIERHFWIYTKDDALYKAGRITSDDDLVEYNISRYKRAQYANEVVEYKDGK